MAKSIFGTTNRILAVIVASAIISGCKPEQTDNGNQPPPIVEPGDGSSHEHPTPNPEPPPPQPDPVPPTPDPAPPDDPKPQPDPTPPPDNKPPDDPSEPNWDSATHVEIATGEFVYDPGKKVWSCYSRDTSSVVWKIVGTGKYPVPKELDVAAICGCCGYHGTKITLMIPKEWDNVPDGKEKGRDIKRAVVMPTGDTKFDGPDCGGTCSCKE